MCEMLDTMPKAYDSQIFLFYCVGNSLFSALVISSLLAVLATQVLPTTTLPVAIVGSTCRLASLALQWAIWCVKPSGNHEVSPCGWLSTMQVLFPVTMSLATGLRLISELTRKNCSEDAYDPVHLMCNKYFDDGGLSLTLFVELMFSPIITFSLLRDTRMEGIWASWLIICSVLFAYCIVLHCPDIAVATLFYLLASALLYFDSQLRLKKTTDLVHRLQDTLAENERLAVEAQAVELRAMIGNIAHDLKSPLTSFLSGVECMLEVVTSWENLLLNGNHAQFMAKAGANLHAIKKCIHSMSGTNSFMTMTINRCLDYTKASKGFHLVPKQETVTLKSVLEMPIRMLRDMQQKIEIRVRPWNDTICSHIITDKQWLLENLLCLLSNAVKYSNSGHVEVGVYLRDARNQEVTGRDMQVSRRRDSPHAEVTQDPELMLLFEVQDAGIGLSDEAMQTLFNPFKQAQRLAGGTGLGLFSLAKRVEALHGHYGVSRRPDGAQGSLFWFSIPYRPDEMTAAMGRSTNGFTPSPASSDSSHGVFLHLPDIPDATLVADPFALSAPCKYQILVVDDAPLIVRMTTMLLSRKGHTVTHAVNGAEALDRILAGYADEKSDAEPGAPPFDVVVMDLQMPIMDGMEALKRLRAAEYAMQQAESTGGTSSTSVVTAVSAQAQHNISTAASCSAPARPPLPRFASNGKLPALGFAGYGHPDSVDLESGEGSLLPPLPPLPAITRRSNANSTASSADRRGRFHQYVLAVSANSDNETVQAALDAGADGFISKPFTYDSFTEAMQQRACSR